MRDLETLAVPPLGRVVWTGNPLEPVVLQDAAGGVVEPVREFLADLQARDLAELSLRSYANDLLRWFRFLAAVDVGWAEAAPEDARDFILWMRAGGKFVGHRQPRTVKHPTI